MDFIENLNKILFIQFSIDTVRKFILELHYRS